MSSKFIHDNWKYLPTSPKFNENQTNMGDHLTSQTSLADIMQNKTCEFYVAPVAVNIHSSAEGTGGSRNFCLGGRSSQKARASTSAPREQAVGVPIPLRRV